MKNLICHENLYNKLKKINDSYKDNLIACQQLKHTAMNNWTRKLTYHLFNRSPTTRWFIIKYFFSYLFLLVSHWNGQFAKFVIFLLYRFRLSRHLLIRSLRRYGRFYILYRAVEYKEKRDISCSHPSVIA